MTSMQNSCRHNQTICKTIITIDLFLEHVEAYQGVKSQQLQNIPRYISYS